MNAADLRVGDLRKGWCPGALRPMPARDGLLVRLRITGGIVPSAAAHAIADLAARHGNGLLDLSARANLQIRGISADALPALLEALDALDLLDEDPGGEAVRNVLCSPLAGLAPGRPDLRPLAAALEAALVGERSLHALPPKFGFLLDDRSAPGLTGVAADVRLDWAASHGAFILGFGGTAATALPLGLVAIADAVAATVATARRCLALPGPPRRARTLLREMGRDTVAAALVLPGSAAPPRIDEESGGAADLVGPRVLAGIATLGLAAPFGRLDTAMLRAAADVADAATGELRLTPWRALMVPRPAMPIDLAALETIGFITDAADPRLRVAACTGANGCERGTTDTHADAAALAPLAASLPSAVTLHVSGCAKGCAHPAPTAVTLVGRDGRYDVLRDGRPDDPPALLGLDLAALRTLLAAA